MPILFRHICVMEPCRCGRAGATWHIWKHFFAYATATRQYRARRPWIPRRFATLAEAVVAEAVVVAEAAVAKLS